MAPFKKGRFFLGLKSSQPINGCSKITWGMTLSRNGNPSNKMVAASNWHSKMTAEGKWQPLRGDVGGAFCLWCTSRLNRRVEPELPSNHRAAWEHVDYDSGRKGIFQGQKEVGNWSCDQDGRGTSMSSRTGGCEVTWSSLAVGYTSGRFGCGTWHLGSFSWRRLKCRWVRTGCFSGNSSFLCEIVRLKVIEDWLCSFYLNILNSQKWCSVKSDFLTHFN